MRASLLPLVVLGWLLATDAHAVEGLSIKVDPAEPRGTYTMVLRAKLDAPPLAVRHVVIRYCDYKDRVAFLEVCRNYRVENNTSWTYGLINPPIIPARDYHIAGRVPEDLTPEGTGRFQMDWWEDDKGPKERPGIVRIPINRGSYTVEPADGGKRSAMVYKLTIAPGGWLPIWIVRLVGHKAADEQIRRIENLAKEKARQGGWEIPVAGHPWDWVKPEPLGLPVVEQARPVNPPG